MTQIFCTLVTLSAALVSLAQLSVAQASDSGPKLYRDDSGMVRCMTAKDSIGWPKDILFTWDETSRYQKTVIAHDLSHSFIDQNGPGGDSTGWFHDRDLSCSDWKQIRDFHFDVSGDSDTVAGFSTSVFEINLPDEVRASVEQVSYGGSTLRTSDDPKSFLPLISSVDPYSLADNVKFSQNYGTPFAGEIYRSWIEAQPFNRDLELDLYWQIKQTLGTDLPARTDVKILVVDGFGGGLRRVSELSDQDRADPRTPSILMGDVVDLLNQQGFDVEGIRTPPYGKFDDNVATVEAALQRALEGPKPIVFLSLSRGVGETMSAIADLRKNAKAQGHLDAIEGRIAVLSLSGLFKGSLIADFVRSNSLMRWFGFLLQRITGTTADGNLILSSADLTIPKMTQRYEENLADLPADLSIWNLVGIVPKLKSRFDHLRPYWDDVAAVNQPNHGAHDGLIEYPLMEAPRSDFKRARTLVFDSTHYLVDGEFMTFDMTKKDERETVFRTLLLNFIEYSYPVTPTSTP